jgi:predicted RNA-binding protein with RPS1 domain
VEDYGVFVRLPKGKMGLAHISNLAQKYPDSLTNHFKVGGKMKVIISNIDATGKIGVKELR